MTPNPPAKIPPTRLHLPQVRPVVGILRGFSDAEAQHIVRAACQGGLHYLEITMNTPGAERQIAHARQTTSGQLRLGAGTVIDLPTLDRALAAGAEFIVTPVVQPPVIIRCVELGVPVFPGAMTPTEIAQAWALGATMVKVFPSESLGPDYVRSLKRCLPEIRLLPTGGVDLGSIGAYVAAGADGFGIGSPLFPRDRVAAGDAAWLTQRCRMFVAAAQPAELDRILAPPRHRREGEVPPEP